MGFGKTNMKWLSLGLFLLLGLIFLIPGIFLYRKAFPEASIDFKISRNEALERGESFLSTQGVDHAGYMRSVRFDYDFEAKIFLEREIGLEKSNNLLADQIRIWHWKIRWFKPHEKEEYEVLITPQGDVSGYERILPEDEERKSVDQDEALRIAERFLRNEGKILLQDYSLIERDCTKLEKRTDYSFTWEKAGFQLAGGTYRIAVTVQGNQVGSFREFMKIPEEWSRSYSRMASRNDLLQNIASLLTIPLLLAVPVTLLLRMRRRDVKWRIGVFLGVFLFILYVLQGVNSLPLYLSDFDTSQSFGSFAGNLAMHVIVRALMFGVIAFIIVMAAEPLYREQFPERLFMGRFFSTEFFRTREFFSSATAGYAFTFFHIGYVVIFYLLVKRIGAWSPAEVPYTNALSTFIPWIYPLTASVTASLGEELIFRVFAISLLRKFLPAWMAVVIPAFLWGFLHSNYPQQPFFIRGIEVGLLGILAGVVFLRWGFFATLIWHYSIDALFIGLFLFSSSNFYFILSGFLVVGLLIFPMIFCLVSLARKGFMKDEGRLRNIDETPARERTDKIEAREIFDKREFLSIPLSRKKIAFLLAAAVLSLILILSVHRNPPWGKVRESITPSRARLIAQEFLKKRRFDPSPFKSVVSFENLTGAYEDRYIQNVQGWSGLQRAYETFKSRIKWKVRFFIPLSEEEYYVSMNEQGEDISFSHIMPEDRKLPGTTVEEARRRAERYLETEKNQSLTDYQLVDTYQDKRPNRVDYTFVWKSNKEQPAKGEYRVTVSVTDDEVTAFSKSIKIPEEWKKRDEQEYWWDIVFAFFKVILIAGAGGFAVALFIREFISRRMEWKIVMAAPILAVSCVIVRELNRLPTIFEWYETSVQPSTYLISRMTAQLLQAGGMFIVTLVISSAMCALWRECDPEKALLPRSRASMHQSLKDALICAPCIVLISLAAWRLYEWLNRTLNIPRAKIFPELFFGMDTSLPFIDVACSSIILASFLTPLLFFGLLFFKRYLRRSINFYFLSLPAVAMYLAGDVKSIGEFIFIFVLVLCAVSAIFHIMKIYLQDNIMGCFLTLVFLSAILQSHAFFSLSSAYYQINGILALACVLIFSCAGIIAIMRRRVER